MKWDTLDVLSRPGMTHLQFFIIANQRKCQFCILLANLKYNDKNELRRKKLWPLIHGKVVNAKTNQSNSSLLNPRVYNMRLNIV